MTRKELCAVAGEPFFERVAAEDAARVQFTIDMLRLSIKLEKHGFVMY